MCCRNQITNIPNAKYYTKPNGAKCISTNFNGCCFKCVHLIVCFWLVWPMRDVAVDVLVLKGKPMANY